MEPIRTGVGAECRAPSGQDGTVSSGDKFVRRAIQSLGGVLDPYGVDLANERRV